jgi:hypothetical protein
MKREICLTALFFVLAVSGAFTEEAKVMPKQVGRFYVAPTLAFASGDFNEDGEYEAYGSGEGSLQAFNLGFVLEYGINDWVSGAVQWAPGATVWSDVDTKVGASDDINANGLADLFLGAKVQFVGEKAPLKSSLFRFSIAPGVKVPMLGPNYGDQYGNVAKGDPVTAANQDKHVLGVGFRSYFDYLINDRFTVNLYCEFLGYPLKGGMKSAGLEEYMVASGIDSFQAQLPALAQYLSYGDVDYGYELTFEVEAAYSFPLAQGITFTAGLPLNYKTSPGKKYDIQIDDMLINNPIPAISGPANDLAAASEDEGATGIFSIKPQVTVFFTNFKLPTEFRLTYTAPLAGLRQRATHSVTLQSRFYFR